MKARLVFVFSTIIFYANPMEDRTARGSGFYKPEGRDCYKSSCSDSSPKAPIKSFETPAKIFTYIASYLQLLSPKNRARVVASLDIDGTLGDADDPLLRDDIYSINTIVAATIIPTFAHMNPYNRVFKDHIKLMHDSQMKPLDSENTMSNLVKLLFVSGAFPIANTSRSEHYSSVTQKQLQRDLDIDFGLTVKALKEEKLTRDDISCIPFETEPPSSFRDGHLYCCGTNPKSERLAEFLTHLKIDHPKIIHIDDRMSHLYAMRDKFPEAELLFLARPSVAEDFSNPELVKTALALPPDELTDLENRAYKKFKLLKIKAEDSQCMLHMIYETLQPFPKTTYITTSNIDHMITNLFGEETYTKERKIIIKILLAYQQGIRKNTPAFRFITDKETSKQYVAIYLAEEDSVNHCLAIGADGEIRYTTPKLIPCDYLYEDNLGSLREIAAQKDRTSFCPTMTRTTSLFDQLDLRGSPPQSPGPLTSSCTPPLRHFLREPKSP